MASKLSDAPVVLRNPREFKMRLSLVAAITSLVFFWSVSALATGQTECIVLDAHVNSFADSPLPERTGPRIQTSGRVPHIQIGVEPVQSLNDQLYKLSYLLPGLEEHPTIVSLPGAKGMWLKDDVPVEHPKAIVSGREFAHIHTDGSLHAPLSYERALEVEQKGWGEIHPWADRRDGWEGLVMLYSATDEEQLKVLIQLVTESYNYVTGLSVPVPEC